MTIQDVTHSRTTYWNYPGNLPMRESSTAQFLDLREITCGVTLVPFPRLRFS